MGGFQRTWERFQHQGIGEGAEPPQCRGLAQPAGIFHEDIGVQLRGSGGEGFRQHLDPTDKPRTLCGVQEGGMANSLLYLLRTERWGRASDSDSFAPSQDFDDTAPSAKGQGAPIGAPGLDAKIISPTTCSRSAKGNACRGFSTWFERLDGDRGALPDPLTIERCWPHPSTGVPNRANQSSAWWP